MNKERILYGLFCLSILGVGIAGFFRDNLTAFLFLIAECLFGYCWSKY